MVQLIFDMITGNNNSHNWRIYGDECASQRKNFGEECVSQLKHYKPPPLTIMWMNYDSSHFFQIVFAISDNFLWICGSEYILYVSSFHTCMKLKYKTANMFEVFLWYVCPPENLHSFTAAHDSALFSVMYPRVFNVNTPIMRMVYVCILILS